MVVIGKNVIENLTTAMYEISYTVYREYIQNAADSIDKAISIGLIDKSVATIDIEINHAKRQIIIYDNAMGISAADFYKILTDVADSTKDRTKDKGFRGIGRLAGLAYCKKLIFCSTYSGEDVESILEWDGVKLREILNDDKQHPSASELIDSIISNSTKSADKDNHYFKVIMDGIVPEADDLLDVKKVIDYLKAVAPVPYENYFYFRSKIKQYCEEENLKIDEYNININGNRLGKYYTTKIHGKNGNDIDEIIDLSFKKFTNKEGKLIAWMWFGIMNFVGVIPPENKMRCLRLRKDNIQIGDEDTLKDFFKEPRGNSYFVGEVYAIDNDLIPNARRDYFIKNAACKEFEKIIKPFLYNELSKLYRDASTTKNIFKKEEELLKKTQEYNIKEKKGLFINEEEKKQAKKDLEDVQNKVQKNKRTLEGIKKKAETDPILKKVYNQIEEKYDQNLKSDIDQQNVLDKEGKKNNKKYLSQALTKYGRKEQKLISRIYGIIMAMLPKDMAEMVITKIQEELSK